MRLQCRSFSYGADGAGGDAQGELLILLSYGGRRAVSHGERRADAQRTDRARSLGPFPSMPIISHNKQRTQQPTHPEMIEDYRTSVIWMRGMGAVLQQVASILSVLSS